MRSISTELKVGVFALAVLSVLAFMTFKVGGLEWAKSRGYTIYIYFNNTAGLDEKTKVKVAGVDSGVIDGIELTKGRARVKLMMDSHIKLYRDAGAAIKSSGLLGDKFLAITVGSPDQPQLRDGDTIENVKEVVDIDDMVRNFTSFSKRFSELSESLNELLGDDETRDSLRQTVSNMREVTASLNRTIDANDARLRKLLENMSSMAASINSLVEKNSDHFSVAVANMKDFSGSLKSDGPELIENLNRASKELRAMIEENRPMVKNAVESMDTIAKNIEKGEGSLGKLVKDDRLYESINKAAEGVNKTISAVDRFRTFITFQTEYLTKPKDGKGYFYVTLQPRPDKYYILGAVSDPVGSVSTKETITSPPGTIVREEEIRKKIEFTAQFAKRFGDAALRIGLTENTFGVGGDYFFNRDRGKVTADIWDFSNDERNAKNPHVKVGVDYFVFKNVFVSGGVDNILNKKWRGGYVGGGLRFEDEDFKYIFGTIPKIPTR
ncbi:MAG: MCE family protein [Nitrospirae bacterium]|nr:MCE family protein [Nitrospirota bacterium]